MFNIIKNKNVIEIQAFTASKATFDYFQLSRGPEWYPEWWKKLPKNHYNSVYDLPTMKTCYGFLELYKNSFIQPLWADLFFTKKNIGKTNLFYDEKQNESKHGRIFIHDSNLPTENTVPENMIGGMIENPKKFIVKINSPWVFLCNEDIQFLQLNCDYNNKQYENLFKVLPGILTFKYQHESNIFIEVFDKDKDVLVPANSPMRHIIPLTNKKVKILHKYDPGIMQSLANGANRFKQVGWINTKIKLDKIKEKFIKNKHTTSTGID